MKCWICDAEEAATREHLAKASDLRALFGKPSQLAPFFQRQRPPRHAQTPECPRRQSQIGHAEIRAPYLPHLQQRAHSAVRLCLGALLG